MQIISLSCGGSLCQGELAVDSIDSYLRQIGRIDFVYTATPNSETMFYWYRGRTSIPQYEEIIRAFYDICCVLQPRELHIEGGTNSSLLEKYFLQTFSHYTKRPITYSAPNVFGSSFVHRQQPYYLHSFGEYQIDFSFQYSHEFVDKILQRGEKLRCFDPFIGRGLLSQFCIKHGHECHGIDMSSERLSTISRNAERTHSQQMTLL